MPCLQLQNASYQSIKLKDKYGQEFEIPMNTMMGAEGRYEDYVYLNMLEQEWRRPVSKYDAMPFMSQDKKPAAKAIIVLVFWTYFETRIERLLASAMRNLPDSIRQNLFKTQAKGYRRRKRFRRFGG